MSFLTTIKNDIEALWRKEEPTVEEALKAAVKAVEPVWETALGKLALATVQGLTGYAASNGERLRPKWQPPRLPPARRTRASRPPNRPSTP